VWTVGDLYLVVGTGSSSASPSIVDGAPAVFSTATDATGAVVDSSGNVLFDDDLDGSVRILAVSNANPGYTLGTDCSAGLCVWAAGDVFTIAGNHGIGTTSGDGASALAAEFSEPHGLAVDGSGNVAVADSDEGESVRIVAESPTNPGYVLKSDCGGGSAATSIRSLEPAPKARQTRYRSPRLRRTSATPPGWSSTASGTSFSRTVRMTRWT
jgi:hypothetical protein